jgi:hypothetical protein
MDELQKWDGHVGGDSFSASNPSGPQHTVIFPFRQFEGKKLGNSKTEWWKIWGEHHE